MGQDLTERRQAGRHRRARSHDVRGKLQAHASTARLAFPLPEARPGPSVTPG
jgi:hypothetical protein